MSRFLSDEISNSKEMVKEAIRRSDELPPEATLGSALDSLNQMPDFIVEEITHVKAENFRKEFATFLLEEGSDSVLELFLI